MRFILRSKIHTAIVSETNLNYIGSIGIDENLINKAGLILGEKVLVVDNTNGSRLETYIIKEEANSGKIAIYGSACHLINKGDEIIIMGFELSDNPIEPKIVLVDKNNKFVKFL
ncbi:MAG: aspartate 1-decarboxylase [Candidatus Nealsonbacteria bacterium]